MNEQKWHSYQELNARKVIMQMYSPDNNGIQPIINNG
jgi:hypothetical protein